MFEVHLLDVLAISHSAFLSTFYKWNNIWMLIFRCISREWDLWYCTNHLHICEWASQDDQVRINPLWHHSFTDHCHCAIKSPTFASSFFTVPTYMSDIIMLNMKKCLFTFEMLCLTVIKPLLICSAQGGSAAKLPHTASSAAQSLLHYFWNCGCCCTVRFPRVPETVKRLLQCKERGSLKAR